QLEHEPRLCAIDQGSLALHHGVNGTRNRPARAADDHGRRSPRLPDAQDPQALPERVAPGYATLIACRLAFEPALTPAAAACYKPSHCHTARANGIESPTPRTGHP